MASIDADKEKNCILDWATKHDGEYNIIESNSSTNKSSCFIPFNNENNCIEYGFCNVQEFRKQLDDMWINNPIILEIILPIIVATFKGEPKLQENTPNIQNNNINSESMKIPDYVYVF